MAVDIRNFIVRFAGEAKQHCARMEKELLLLESNGFSLETVDSLFRTAHTIKGAARMMKLDDIAHTSHELENILDELRQTKPQITAAMISTLLSKVDAIRSWAAGIDMSPVVPPSQPIPAVPVEVAPVPPTPAPSGASVSSTEVAASLSTRPPRPTTSAAAKQTTPESGYMQVSSAQLDDLIQLMGEAVSFQYRKKKQLEVVQSALRMSNELAALLADSGPTAAAVGRAQEQAARTQQQIKVLYEMLRNDGAIESQVTTLLQERSLKLRMLPISTVFGKFARTVRDLAQQQEKKIELQIEGGSTELDRKIIELLEDCLLHLLRNAIGHGIETPAERAAAGKPANGVVRLVACYEDGFVRIIVEDDGGGISLAAIKHTAVQRKVASNAELDKMSKDDLLNLIFLPGFSTSSIITDLSGRGVGMDVVRQTIEADLQGSIKVQTQPGQGTMFVLKVPISLALSRMLLVMAAGQTLAMPAAAVRDMLRVRPDEIIEVINKRALRFREQLIPVEALASILNCPQQSSAREADRLVIIIDSGAEQLALLVDEIVEEADMLVKTVPMLLQRCPFISGFTVGSDTEVFSVLHISAVLAASRSVRYQAPVVPISEVRAKSVLVVDDSVNTRDIQKSILEAYGYQVEVAVDGMDALEKTTHTLYDAIITDVEMPQCDGFTLTTRLRQDERYREVPIIIVTSREKDEDKRRGIQAGANAYIVKGAFDQNNLLETIQNLMG